MKNASPGVTLPELMVGMAIMGIITVAFATFLRFTIKTATSAQTGGEAQEETRQALMKIEDALSHATEITISSGSLVEFVADIDQSPLYDREADWDGDGIPNWRDADRDGDAWLVLPASAQWQAGDNLRDDDEDGDGRIDARRRLYLSGGDLWLDMSVNEEPWGAARLKKIMTGVSTFTLTYWGNKANALGRNIDLGNDGAAGTGDAGENDGIISQKEMDMVAPPAGMGNRNGALDARNERRYITSIRIGLGSDKNRDGKTDYAAETDIYPPLLPLKSR
ncbi:MAG: type II secretion system protein [Elusimicrobia bacterium]|nr:type II secretion system protein [Elusimicrobiota bacterium]